MSDAGQLQAQTTQPKGLSDGTRELESHRHWPKHQQSPGHNVHFFVFCENTGV